MSIWSIYSKELWDRETIEEDWGFIQYHFDHEGCWIDEIFVTEAFRRRRYAFDLADRVTQIARDAGKRALAAQVWPHHKGADAALKACLAYGFLLHSSDGGRIILTKEI